MALTRTVRQVIDVATEHEEMDAARALQLFNEAHLYILTQVRLVPDTTLQVGLTQGTQEYALPDNVCKIWDAAYYTSASDWTPLKATNVDSLFEDSGPNWQLQASGQPWGFYERGGMIGFAPVPSVSTVSGYPNVTLFYTPATGLGLDDTLPTNISSIYPWVYRMCELMALGGSGPFGEKQAKQARYAALFQDSMHYLREYMYGRVARDRARVSVRVPRIKRA
jgi:hypothetical protein